MIDHGADDILLSKKFIFYTNDKGSIYVCCTRVLTAHDVAEFFNLKSDQKQKPLPGGRRPEFVYA